MKAFFPRRDQPLSRRRGLILPVTASLHPEGLPSAPGERAKALCEGRVSFRCRLGPDVCRVPLVGKLSGRGRFFRAEEADQWIDFKAGTQPFRLLRSAGSLSHRAKTCHVCVECLRGGSNCGSDIGPYTLSSARSPYLVSWGLC